MAEAGMPRWVKITLVIAAVLTLVVVVGLVTGVGGEHGPGRHGAVGVKPPAEAAGR
jgi:hypothetical protein